MPEEDLLELETRRRIYRHLQEHPGEHMRELGRTLALPMGTLEYHLHQMVKAGLLAIREDPRFTRYFVAGSMGRREKDVMSVLRQEVPRQVAAFLLAHPDSSHGTILAQFDLSASTLTFHLKKLLATNIAVQRREGRENRYTLTEPDLVAKVLIAYRATFLDDVVDRFVEAFMSLAPREEQPPRGGLGGLLVWLRVAARALAA